MPIVTYVIGSPGGLGSFPVFINGRSIASSADGTLDFDVYSMVNSDIRGFANGFFTQWNYGVRWNATIRLTNPTNSLYKEFSGVVPRRNVGIFQYGLGDGVLEDEDWRYYNQTTKYKAFIVNSGSVRATSLIPTSTTVSSSAVQAFGGINGNLAVLNSIFPWFTDKLVSDRLYVRANFGASFAFYVSYIAYATAVGNGSSLIAFNV